jgi:ribosomal protein S18 acetylase RimI-like enzyme
VWQLGFFISETSSLLPIIIALKSSSQEEFHFPKKFHIEMDVCRILPLCFKSFAETDLNGCQNKIENIMTYFDSGYLIERAEGSEGSGEVVGFLSAVSVKKDKHNFILIYNVCIDESRRGRGLGRKLLSEFIEEYVSLRELPRDSVYIALGVDLETPSSAEALQLYGKSGFVQWMEPCSRLDKDSINSKRAICPPKPPLERLAEVIYDPKKYAHECFNGRTAPIHFCMYK